VLELTSEIFPNNFTFQQSLYYVISMSLSCLRQQNVALSWYQKYPILTVHETHHRDRKDLASVDAIRKKEKREDRIKSIGHGYF